MLFYKTLDLFLEPKCFLAIENHYKVAVAFYGCPANFLVKYVNFFHCATYFSSLTSMFTPLS